jgi:flagellin-like hook-associated protein FlgL
LNADKLSVKFNENGTSSIDVQATDTSGNAFAITASNLGITAQTTTNFGSNATLDTLSTTLSTALTTLRSQASSLGSQLSVVQARQDFTKSMINTLQTGADNLVLADTNQEGANMLALQTRQSLSTTALSLSAQADQAVLRLFG